MFYGYFKYWILLKIDQIIFHADFCNYIFDTGNHENGYYYPIYIFPVVTILCCNY